MKAFVAVIPPLHIREYVARNRHVTQPVEKMHITVHFFGTITKTSLKLLTEKFITIESGQICTMLAGGGSFNNLDGSAYIGARPETEWIGLHQKVADTFGHGSFKKYKPHLTVATFKGTPVPSHIADDFAQAFLIPDLLFNADKISLLTSENGVYKIVNTVWLRKR